MKLTSIRLIANDIQQSVTFYEEILGLTAQWFTPDFAEVSTSSITIAIRVRCKCLATAPLSLATRPPLLLNF